MKLRLLVIAGSCFGLAAAATSSIRGVAKSKLPLYDLSSGSFTCLDGSLNIPALSVNDDFCDCPDGSDEPGTSACPEGRFHCKNVWHVPAYIASSRVNDGVCDPECCDGTDEYDGRATCPNICKEVGKRHREKQLEKNRAEIEGARAKLSYIASAEQARVTRSGELERLEQEVTAAQATVDMIEEVKTAAEMREKEAKDAVEAAYNAKICGPHVDGLNAWLDQILAAVKALEGSAAIGDPDVLKAVAVAEEIVEERRIKESREASEEETELEKEARLAKDQADIFRKELSEARDALRTFEKERDEINRRASFDYGEKGEFDKLDGLCLSADTPEYTYEICLFSSATQKSKTGGSNTNLG
ncbi:glucosidase II beta subunit-like-domain-containing protein [Blyttiomyces helicus]|uniref:Glucosidase II beta subunit-like-domain-containing protein n=1 Tax=Blyttiomyces helicus TaxID=388810 RepID=A0A4P9WKG2_9FUNG|nr:glucosidase II beta subunit-like-domain-containing protein [Blyttiomyces helicus]|eukprot:RKO91650.1 glucosidase II beta subunit-like-domain-containing protein [Blyttiomyces helicus]